MNPLQVPQQGPIWRELSVSRTFINRTLEFLTKVLLIKKILPFSRRGLRGGTSPHVPQNGPLWKQMPISRALLSVSFGDPSKGTLPLGSPHRTPTERDASLPEPSFIHLSKSLVEPLSRFPMKLLVHSLVVP